MKNFMRAAQLKGPRNFEMAEAPIPEPKLDEVRIKLEGCGVCASNLVPWGGAPWITYPLPPGALGHEGWGAIDALGSNVKKFNVGDRVAALSNHAYAEYDVTKAASVLKIPHDLSFQNFPGEAFGCAMNIFRRMKISSGESVAIIGIGFLGSILTTLCHQVGAKVTAISRRDYALKMASDLGADQVIPMIDHGEIIKKASELTEGKFFDCVVEAVGKQWPLNLAGELTREGGRLVIAGYHQDGPRSVNMQLWNWRGLDVINAHERDLKICLKGIDSAIDATSLGIISPPQFLTHSFFLDQISDAFESTMNRPEGFLKAFIKYES
ncbi:MAG: Threonine dehydrogenase-related Zn-dependent dehydrogenase [Bacteriovoracaceae bacterium]|nr:Threonine dehydrogenase-related Zn-dependent dehydrogenase [Bacteriovoracaceae bacterium]